MKLKLFFIGVFLLSLSSYAQFDENEGDAAGTNQQSESVESNVYRPQMAGSQTPGEASVGASSEDSGSTEGQAGASVLDKNKKEKFAKASVDEITDKNYPEVINSFEFNNADINDVIKAIGELTGKNFILDSKVKGTITIMAPSKITVAEAYKAFLSALAINHLTVVPSGSFYKIKPSKEALRDNIESYSGEYYPTADQMITRIVHLKHISAEQLARELDVFKTNDGNIKAFSSTNSLIIGDYGSTVDRIMKVINELDTPGFEEKLVVLKVNNASAREMADMINRIVSNEGGGGRGASGPGGSYSTGITRFGGRAFGSSTVGTGNAVFMVVPDERTNSLLVMGNKEGVERVKKIVKQLDFKIDNDSNGGLHVYYVKYGDAEKIAKTLSGITKDRQSGSGGTGRFISPAAAGGGGSSFGSRIDIEADKDTNSLVIAASKADYDQVLDLLSRIDIPRDQVFVEAVILEMLLEDEMNWGIGYYSFDKASKGLGRQGFMSNDKLSSVAANPLSGLGTILSFATGGIITIGNDENNPIKITSFMGLLNFLKGTGRTNVLSTPQIMAIDNEDAEIEVGDEVAVAKDVTLVNGVQNINPRFKKATIKLKIKPFISPTTDSIRMSILQEINQPGAKPSLPDTLPLSTRSISTNIVVPDGDTAVLGGLVKDHEQETVTKVPILGDVPIVGWLFKGRKVEKVKTNLFVFITPKIIRTASDNHKLLDKKIGERLDFIKKEGGKDPHGKVIDSLPRKAPSKRPTSPRRDPKDPGQGLLMDPLSPQSLMAAPPLSPAIPVVEPPPKELLEIPNPLKGAAAVDKKKGP